MNLFVVGLNYRTAPVELREKLAISPRALRCQACRLRTAGRLDELVLLTTCNRVELYGTAGAAYINPRQLLGLLSSPECDLGKCAYVHRGVEAVAHLFKVTAALDSMVLGETEITGQVKRAYEQAREAGLTGRILNQAFQRALQTAKEIRTQTGIGRGATSVASAAAEVARKIFGAGLHEHQVMILGAGQMGTACARHLARQGARLLLVANRSPERAQALAAEVEGRPFKFEDYLAALAHVDVLIASTACPVVVLTQAGLERVLPARRGRPLFLLDISVPRNIDPAVQRLEGVYLYNIDDLQEIARQNVSQRAQALPNCERIIAHAAAALWKRLSSLGPNRPEFSQTPPRWLIPSVGATVAA